MHAAGACNNSRILTCVYNVNIIMSFIIIHIDNSIVHAPSGK